MPEDYVTMKEAQRLLGVSNQKMWRLVRDGVLEAIRSPLDGRVKLIRRSDLDKLLELRPPSRNGAATRECT